MRPDYRGTAGGPQLTSTTTGGSDKGVVFSGDVLQPQYGLSDGGPVLGKCFPGKRLSQRFVAVGWRG